VVFVQEFAERSEALEAEMNIKNGRARKKKP
jgi:predicted GIY-YIG superfamily endonuclease